MYLFPQMFQSLTQFKTYSLNHLLPLSFFFFQLEKDILISQQTAIDSISSHFKNNPNGTATVQTRKGLGE